MRSKTFQAFVLVLLIVLTSSAPAVENVLAGSSPNVTLVQSSYYPRKVFPGDEEVAVTAVIGNTGTSTAENTKAVLHFPDGFTPSYAGADKANLGNIPSMGQRSITFYVDIDESAEPETYELRLTLDWEGSSTEKGIPVTVSKKASFKIEDVETNRFRIEPGDRGIKLSVTIRNTGEVEAKEVNIQLIGGMFSGTVVSFLGTLYPGQSRQAVFEVDLSELSETGDVQVQVQIEWLQEGRTLDTTLMFTLTISPPLIPWYGWVIILAIISLVAYRYRAKLKQALKERIGGW